MSKLDELRSTVAGLRDDIVRLSAIDDITLEDDAALDAALTGRAPLARWVVGVGAWALWALGAVVLAIPRTTSHTLFLSRGTLLPAATCTRLRRW